MSAEHAQSRFSAWIADSGNGELHDASQLEAQRELCGACQAYTAELAAMRADLRAVSARACEVEWACDRSTCGVVRSECGDDACCASGDTDCKPRQDGLRPGAGGAVRRGGRLRTVVRGHGGRALRYWMECALVVQLVTLGACVFPACSLPAPAAARDGVRVCASDTFALRSAEDARIELARIEAHGDRAALGSELRPHLKLH